MVLLIDNCSLLQLINAQGYGKFLLELNNHVDNGHITLITHETLLAEWEKHKQADRKRKEKSLQKQLGKPGVTPETQSLTLPKINLDHLDMQIEQIDNLLKKAEVIATPQIITYEFAERYKERLAPFHNKLNGINDWEIIGSACLHCENYGQKQLYFISSNFSDFAAPDHPLNKIHGDIQNRFPKVRINYFQFFRDFFKELDFSIVPHNLIPGNISKNEKFSHKSSMKKNDLDSLFFLFHDLYEELSFIPLHLLKDYYPFKEPGNDYTYYSLFCLYEVNSSLITLFEQIEFDKKNDIRIINDIYFTAIEDHENKLDYVLKKLTNNQIFNLEGKLNKKPTRISVYYPKYEFCDCARCSFYRFDFLSALKKLIEPATSLYEKLKHAYIYYQLKEYSVSHKLLLEIRDEAYNSKKYIQYFISQYNLSHLSVFLSSPFYGGETPDQQVKDLKNIDPIEECVKLKSHTDYELLHYIAKGDFFSWAFQNISDFLEQIMLHYESQLHGGWSSNNHVWKLIEVFSNLESFVSNNFIMFEHYSNFDKLFDLVTKGILASHAMNKSQDGKYQEFDNNWVKKFVLYGSTKTILKYFQKFKLRDLKYKNDTQGTNFMNLAQNLLNDRSIFIETFSEKVNEDNDFTSTSLDKYIENIITMAGLINLDDHDVNEFGVILLEFIKTNHIDHITLNAITQFIARKGESLEQPLLIQYVDHYLRPSEIHSDNILAFLFSYLKQRPPHLQILKMITESLNRNKNGRMPLNHELFAQLYEKANSEEKVAISQLINEYLDNKFDLQVYHICLMRAFIPFDKKVLLDQLAKIDPSIKNNGRRFFGEKEFHNRNLNALINICFKYNINTKTKKFHKFWEVHPYYKWLLNMDEFDYKDFDTEWASAYGTYYYFREMSKSKKLISYLIKYLEKSSNPLLEDTFVRINMHKNRK